MNTKRFLMTCALLLAVTLVLPACDEEKPAEGATPDGNPGAQAPADSSTTPADLAVDGDKCGCSGCPADAASADIPVVPAADGCGGCEVKKDCGGCEVKDDCSGCEKKTGCGDSCDKSKCTEEQKKKCGDGCGDGCAGKKTPQ